MIIKSDWINDPTGLIKLKGIYHLYFQYLPKSNIWDLGIGWGHATSKDLKSWKMYHNRVLTPSIKYDKDGCFSGSVINIKNKIYSLYTGVVEENKILHEYQCLAYSSNGTNFIKYPEPIIKNPPVSNTYGWRDPFIFIYEDTYYILIGSGWDKKGRILLYQGDKHFPSKKWDYKGELISINEKLLLECPFIAFISNNICILGASRDNKSPIYWIGKFNGTKFIPKNKEYKVLKSQDGYNIYAPTIVNINEKPYFWTWIRDTNSLYGPCKIEYNEDKKLLKPLKQTQVE
jgi:beta-fructofuranosidase